ncbi:MAG: DUF4124 domain-containing protein, partial [Nevskiales bacterium]|nr:DUF4124 domain-containing protein [Nevskiales bacterium]
MRHGLVLFLLAFLPFVCAAQIYRWVDGKGQVHYTQTPPKDRSYEQVGPAPPPGTAPNQASLNEALGSALEEEPKLKATAEQEARYQAQRQEMCRQAVERLAYLDASTARRLGSTDDQGAPARMTEEEFQ